MFLHVWAQAYVTACIHAYATLFLHTQVCSCLHAWALTRVRETPGKSPTLPTFTLFSTVSPSYAILTPFFVIIAFEITLSFFLSSFLHQNTICLNFTWIMILVSSFSLQSSSPYAGRGSTNKVVEWYNLLVLETKGYIQEVGLSLFLAFFLKRLQVLPWHSASLKGGRTLPTPFILPSGR